MEKRKRKITHKSNFKVIFFCFLEMCGVCGMVVGVVLKLQTLFQAPTAALSEGIPELD